MKKGVKTSNKPVSHKEPSLKEYSSSKDIPVIQVIQEYEDKIKMMGKLY